MSYFRFYLKETNFNNPAFSYWDEQEFKLPLEEFGTADKAAEQYAKDYNVDHFLVQIADNTIYEYEVENNPRVVRV